MIDNKASIKQELRTPWSMHIRSCRSYDGELICR